MAVIGRNLGEIIKLGWLRFFFNILGDGFLSLLNKQQLGEGGETLFGDTLSVMVLILRSKFIFSYVGVSMFTFPKHKFDPAFIFGSFVAIIAGRAANIYPLSFLLNLGRQTKITPALQHMLFLSGLRGAIAFALSISNTLSESRQMILSTTLLIVVITVIVCGGSTMSLLTWLGIPLGTNDEESNPIDYMSSNPSSPQHNYNTVRDDTSSTGAAGADGAVIQV